MTDSSANQSLDAVLKALSSPDYKWRTIPGVAKSTGLEEDIVRQALSQAADQIVRSSVASTDGQDLFTTRERFRESATLSEKLFGAIKNRAV